MNRCSDPNSHETVKINGRRVCSCESCTEERLNLALMRAKANRRMMTGKKPGTLIAWLCSDEWTDINAYEDKPALSTAIGVINAR